MKACLQEYSHDQPPTALPFTPAGKLRLGAVIKESLRLNKKKNEAKGLLPGDEGWLPTSTRTLAAQAGLRQHLTVHYLIRGSVAFADPHTLGAIAPFLYKPKRFIVDPLGTVTGVELNPDKTYSNWQALARLGRETTPEVVEPIKGVPIAELGISLSEESIMTLREAHKIYEFILNQVEFARSQRIKEVSQMEESIGEIIRRWMEKERITPIELQNVVIQASEEFGAKVSPEAIADITAGVRQPTINELRFIYTLPTQIGESECFQDENGNDYKWQDLLRIAGLNPKETAGKATSSRSTRKSVKKSSNSKSCPLKGK